MVSMQVYRGRLWIEPRSFSRALARTSEESCARPNPAVDKTKSARARMSDAIVCRRRRVRKTDSATARLQLKWSRRRPRQRSVVGGVYYEKVAIGAPMLA